MKILSDKNQVKEYLGKRNIWGFNTVAGKVQYHEGIQYFDDLIASTNKPNLINFLVHPEGLLIELMIGLKYHHVGIRAEDLIAIVIEPLEKVFVEKDKSVIGRAVVGGLLLGPVGAIVGGMSGVGTKKVAQKGIENFLTIIHCDENGDEAIAVFSCRKKHLKELDLAWGKRFKTQLEEGQKRLSKQPQTEAEAASPNKMSVADELMKFKELLDAGILTQAEFEEQKAKLLG